MTAFENELRQLVRDIVREELARATDRSSDAEFVTTATAAKIADVTAHTVRRWIREGKLAASGIGRRVRVRRADLARLVEKVADVEGLTPEQMARRDFG